MLESHALLLLDDELCGAALRLARGIEVNEETLALDLIKETGFSGSYIAAEATSKLFRKELFIPKLFSREPYETWEKGGGKLAIDSARSRALSILAKHEPYEIDPAIERELAAFKDAAAARSLDEFYLYETADKQDFSAL